MSKNIAYISRDDKTLERLCVAAKQYIPDFNFYDIEDSGYKGAFAVIVLGSLDELKKSDSWKQIEDIDTHKNYYVGSDASDTLGLLSDQWISVGEKQILIGVIANIKETFKEKMQKGKEFLPLNVSQINKSIETNCDLYIRLSSGKFVKTFTKGTLLDEQFDQYIKKGLDKVWVDVNDFYNMGTDYLEEMFNATELLKAPQEKVNKHIKNIHNISRELGFSQNVIDKVGDMMSTFTSELKADQMQSLIDAFNHEAGSYLYNHSYLLALLCSSISKRMDWDSKENQEKFCLASMFHDLGYENEMNSLIESRKNLEDLNYSQETLDDFKNHEKVIIKKLDGLEVHPDVVKMIKYHHYGELTDSKDKELISGRLNHHCCIFIMSHDLIVELYKSFFRKEKVDDCINIILEKYDTGIFKSVAKIFDTEVRRMFAVKV